jgi:hypothetical protein
LEGEGQRQLHVLCVRRAGQVQRCVEQRRVGAEALRLIFLVFVQDDLAIQVVTFSPCPAKALEGGAVVEPQLCKAVI